MKKYRMLRNAVHMKKYCKFLNPMMYVTLGILTICLLVVYTMHGISKEFLILVFAIFCSILGIQGINIFVSFYDYLCEYTNVEEEFEKMKQERKERKAG